MRPYKKYKPSGIDWIEKIPEEWKVRRIKDLADLKSGNNLTSAELEDNAEFPVYGGNGFRGYYSKYTHNGFYVLIGRQGALCGNINYGNNKFWATDHAVVANHKNFINVFWFGELLKTMNLNQYSLSAAQPGLSVENIKRLKLPFINFQTQTIIANYLDQKTSQIDKKINLLEQKLSKYEELKKTLINETVCRGLDKNVELKESNVEWIGKIPKHWEVKRMKDVCKSINGGAFKDGLSEKGLPIIKIKQLVSGIEAIEFCDPKSAKVNKGNLLKNDDLVFSWSTLIYPFIYKGKDAVLNQHIFKITYIKSTDKNWLYYKLLSSTNRLMTFAHGSTMKHILKSDFENLELSIPSFSEQTQIANYLDEKCTKIDKIRATIKKEITILKEFRKTLINDVVTGKVKIN